MFWPLLLAHLIADYPLQTDAMVQAKKKVPGLTLHVVLHTFTMTIILVGGLRADWRSVLPVILMVAMTHFAIDAWKNILTQRWPQWVIGGYVQDQALHLLSLFAVAFGYARITGTEILAITHPWLIYGCAFILITHVWFITEQIFTYRNSTYQRWVSLQLWPRLMSRVLLFSAVLVGWNLGGLTALVAALTLHWFDLACPYRWRALLTDIGVVASVLLLIQLLTAGDAPMLAAHLVQ